MYTPQAARQVNINTGTKLTALDNVALAQSIALFRQCERGTASAPKNRKVRAPRLPVLAYLLRLRSKNLTPEGPNA